MKVMDLLLLVHLASECKIRRELKQRGYLDCAKDEQLKNVSVVDILKGGKIAKYECERYRKKYVAQLRTNVNGWENYEFIWCEVLQRYKDDYIPKRTFIYAKEMKL